MSINTIRVAGNGTCLKCEAIPAVNRPAVYEPSSTLGLRAHPDGRVLLFPVCQPCFIKARGSQPESNAVLWAKRDAAAREPFEKRLDLDLDPVD